MTELVKAGEQDWAAVLLLLLPCVMFTPGALATQAWCQQRLHYTGGPGDRSSGARELRAPAAGSSLADCECLWRRHPEPGDQLSLPAQWPLGAGVCYELTSAEPEH